jgi:hypothetical protein
MRKQARQPKYPRCRRRSLQQYDYSEEYAGPHHNAVVPHEYELGSSWGRPVDFIPGSASPTALGLYVSGVQGFQGITGPAGFQGMQGVPIPNQEINLTQIYERAEASLARMRANSSYHIPDRSMVTFEVDHIKPVDKDDK